MTFWTLGALLAWASAAPSAPPARSVEVSKPQKVAPGKERPKKVVRKVRKARPAEEAEAAQGDGGGAPEPAGETPSGEEGAVPDGLALPEGLGEGAGAGGGPPSEEDIRDEYQRRVKEETRRINRKYQEQFGQYGPPGAAPDAEGGEGEGGGEEAAPEPPPAPDKPRGPMSLTDAKVNAPTVIEAYFARNSEDGVMPFKEEGGKSWKLKLQRVREGTVRRLAPERFVACADMTDMGDDQTALDVDFTVDFSGPAWAVRSMDVHKAAGESRFEYDDENRRVSKSKTPKKTPQ